MQIWGIFSWPERVFREHNNDLWRVVVYTWSTTTSGLVWRIGI